MALWMDIFVEYCNDNIDKTTKVTELHNS